MTNKNLEALQETISLLEKAEDEYFIPDNEFIWDLKGWITDFKKWRYPTSPWVVEEVEQWRLDSIEISQDEQQRMYTFVFLDNDFDNARVQIPESVIAADRPSHAFIAWQLRQDIAEASKAHRTALSQLQKALDNWHTKEQALIAHLAS